MGSCIHSIHKKKEETSADTNEKNVMPKSKTSDRHTLGADKNKSMQRRIINTDTLKTVVSESPFAYHGYVKTVFHRSLLGSNKCKATIEALEASKQPSWEQTLHKC